MGHGVRSKDLEGNSKFSRGPSVGYGKFDGSLRNI